jgi:hypothetical protein
VQDQRHVLLGGREGVSVAVPVPQHFHGGRPARPHGFGGEPGRLDRRQHLEGKKTQHKNVTQKKKYAQAR